jgi:hypothetical protein
MKAFFLFYFCALLFCTGSTVAQVYASGAPVRSDPPLSDIILIPKDQVREIQEAFYAAGLKLIVGRDLKSLQGDKADLHKWAITAVPVCEGACAKELSGAILPNRLERSLRATQAKIEVAQQPNTSLVQLTPTSAVTAVPNPDHNLLRVSSVTNYSELVPTPDDVQKQAQLLNDAGIWAETSNGLCHHQAELLIKAESTQPSEPASGPVSTKDATFRKTAGAMEHCLLRTGFRNELLRNLSGAKGTFSYSQNPQVQQNLLVPSAISNNNRIFSGQVDFDPSKLFLTGSDWLSAYQAARLYGPDAEANFTNSMLRACHREEDGRRVLRGEARSGLVDADCLRRLAAPRGLKTIAAAVIPAVTYSVKTQFDFIKSGGGLVPAPYATPNLGDLILSIDLTRVIPSAKSRADALSALIAARKHVALDPPGKEGRSVVEYLFERWTETEVSVKDNEKYGELLQQVKKVALPEGIFDRVGAAPKIY